MSHINENPETIVEGKVVEDTPEKKYCFTRKNIITAVAAATTVAAGAAVVVYLRAKGTDAKEVVDAAIDAAKETVENAS